MFRSELSISANDDNWFCVCWCVSECQIREEKGDYNETKDDEKNEHLLIN